MNRCFYFGFLYKFVNQKQFIEKAAHNCKQKKKIKRKKKGKEKRNIWADLSTQVIVWHFKCFFFYGLNAF